MNYLQYINSVYRGEQMPAANFLVSGADSAVRNVIGRHIVDTAHERGRILFLLNNTQGEFDHNYFGSYRVEDIMDGQICLLENSFDVSSLRALSRLRILLMDFDFTDAQAMQVVTFLKFVRETENRFGNSAPIDIETIESYGGTMLVKFKLDQLVKSGKLSKKNCNYLLSRYTEVSAAAADFEMKLGLLEPFINGFNPTEDMAVYVPLGEFDSDKAMQKTICRLITSFVKRNPGRCTTLILDSGKGNRSCLIETLNRMPADADVHLLSTDIFSMDDQHLSSIMNTFPIRIYSKHETMSSCAKIEECCGQIDVVKHSYTTTVDKRIRLNQAYDILLGTNRTEADSRNVPVREPRYRKERINSLSQGAAVIDCGGTQALFQF